MSPGHALELENAGCFFKHQGKYCGLMTRQPGH